MYINKGLIIYTPKKLEDPENFIGTAAQLENIYDDYKTAVLRVLVKIKSPKILKVYDINDEPIEVPVKEQTWEHLVLFESELKAPEFLKSKYKLENYQEWLSKLIRQV